LNKVKEETSKYAKLVSPKRLKKKLNEKRKKAKIK